MDDLKGSVKDHIIAIDGKNASDEKSNEIAAITNSSSHHRYQDKVGAANLCYAFILKQDNKIRPEAGLQDCLRLAG